MWNSSVGFGPFGHGMGAMFGFHGALWLILLAAIVLAVVTLLRDRRRDRAQDAALAALDIRYAKGDISRDEYFRLRQDLGR